MCENRRRGSRIRGRRKQAFLEEMGIEISGLDILIQKAYHLLGLATYFTAGEQEVRAWTFRRGMKAPGNVRESSTQTSSVDLSVPKR